MGAAAVVIGPALLASSVPLLTRGNLLLGAAGVAMAVTAVLAVGYLVRFLVTPRGAHEASLDDGATVLPESRVARFLAWGTTGAAVLLSTLLVLSAVAGTGPTGPSVGLVGATVVLVLAVPTVVAVLAGRRPRGALVLTPHAARLRTWSSEREVAWDDVVEVVALRQPRRTLVVYARMEDQVQVLRAPAGFGEQQARPIPEADRGLAVSFPHLTGDPAVLLAALDHWRRVRKDRAELGAEASLRRLDPAA
ncbi:MAG: hypothetical protein NTV28_00215 [Propionibacteriales bacterium]|nr:hypothetical protein [Propionibacteriales bacterium]